MQKVDLKDRFLFVKEKVNSYVLFLPPDMIAVKVFRTELVNSLREHNFPDDDVIKIELACDEALTNSITANVANNSSETIICRWKITQKKFSLIIMDYGSGIPVDKPKEVSEAQTDSLIDKFQKRQNEPRILPFEGKQKVHKNLGQGLKIIHNLMDTVKVKYHCYDKISAEPNEEDTINGSILEMEFQSKSR